MSRPTKYRAWDNVKNQMYYVGEEDGISFTFDSNGIVAVDLLETEDEFMELHHLVYMQYTGVHDDTDEQEELCDGDIAEVEYSDQKHICKIQYCGGGYIFIADGLPDGYLWFSELIDFEREYCWAKGTKKVGNIYTHPHLMEVQA